MNREIIFRGKREKTGEWVYGYLIKRDEPFLHDIVVPVGNSSQMTYAIIRGTVGQYTGMKDDNGNHIFEGDIIRNDDPTKKYRIGEVRFQDGCFCIFIKGVPCEYITLDSLFRNHDAEVIGNRWDNPELLVTA